MNELISGTSSTYLPTLPKWGIACHGEYGELVTSERLMSEKGCSCAVIGTPTASMKRRSPRFKRKTPNPAEIAEMYLTPQASDAMRSNFKIESLAKRYLKHKGGNLAEQVAYVEMFPTPTVCGNYNKKGISKTSGDGLATVVGGALNPTWVEWLQGVPLGSIDLDV